MKKPLFVLSVLLTFNTNTLMSDNTFKSKRIVQKPAPLTFVSKLDTDGLALGVSIRGNYAYLADSFAGLKIINISNPAKPVIVGTYRGGGPDAPFINEAHRVKVKGNYAYIATKFTGLQIINISNPTHPTFVSGITNKNTTKDVSIQGDYAYATDSVGYLQVINISNPSIPIVVNTYDTQGDAEGVSTSGNYAYVSVSFSGLEIINISNPASPVLASIYDTDNSNDVKIIGKYAYVANFYGDEEGLKILDISNPASPKLIGTSPAGFSGQSISVAGNYAYIASWYGGLHMIDISNPTSPLYAGTYDPKYTMRDVSVVGNYVYIASSSKGLVILKRNIIDTDKDGIEDSIDLDDDNDGISDSDEVALGFNPLNAQDGLADYDRDGFCNAMEFNIGTDMNNVNDKPIWTPILMDAIITFVPTKP